MESKYQLRRINGLSRNIGSESPTLSLKLTTGASLHIPNSVAEDGNIRSAVAVIVRRNQFVGRQTEWTGDDRAARRYTYADVY